MCPKCGAAAEVLPGKGQIGDIVTDTFRCEECRHMWSEECRIEWQAEDMGSGPFRATIEE